MLTISRCCDTPSASTNSTQTFILNCEPKERPFRQKLRLSQNPYPHLFPTPDRVIPAFCRAALAGQPLRIDGGHNTFDFTHISDVAAGVVSLARRHAADQRSFPPIHFVSGIPTDLVTLARRIVEKAGSSSDLVEAPPRSYDVARFWGSNQRAKNLLGWTPKVSLYDGLARLLDDLSGINEFHEEAARV